MSSKLVKNRKRGPNQDDLSQLNSQQQLFVLNLMASENWNGTEAAKNAKYANPSKAAHKLLQNPIIQAVLGRLKQKRQEVLEVTAQEVLQGLFFCYRFNPLEWFKVDKEDGSWVIDDLDSLPPEVGRMIHSFEIYIRRDRYGDEVSRSYKVNLHAHGHDLELKRILMKHFNIDGYDKLALAISGPGYDWEKIYEQQTKADPIDYLIEHGIPEEKPVPKLEYTEAELIDYDEDEIESINEAEEES